MTEKKLYNFKIQKELSDAYFAKCEKYGVPTSIVSEALIRNFVESENAKIIYEKGKVTVRLD